MLTACKQMESVLNRIMSAQNSNHFLVILRVDLTLCHILPFGQVGVNMLPPKSEDAKHEFDIAMPICQQWLVLNIDLQLFGTQCGSNSLHWTVKLSTR